MQRELQQESHHLESSQERKQNLSRVLGGYEIGCGLRRGMCSGHPVWTHVPRVVSKEMDRKVSA
jgi:hypothetical protein